MDDQVTRGPLAALLDDAAAGRFPPADGRVTVLPPPSARRAGVIGFTAHAVIFIDADPAWAETTGASEVVDRVVMALQLAITNVAWRHPELGDGFRDEMDREFRQVARAWTDHHPDPEHPRVA